MPEMLEAKILIIDDHALLRAGIISSLNCLDDFVIQTSEATGITDALHSIRQGNTPNLILLDIQLKGMSGFEGLPLLRRACPHARIAFLSAREESATVQKTIELGAEGFLHKSMPNETWREALKKLLLGQKVFIDNPNLSMSASDGNEMSQDKQMPILALSIKHKEILNLISQGYSNKIIGTRLNLSENTIRFYVSQILTLLQCKSRTQAVYLAQLRGLL
jgi:DNA-binding NarL/FixJ family response regulator